MTTPTRSNLTNRIAIEFPVLVRQETGLLSKASSLWFTEGIFVEGTRFRGRLRVWAVRYPIWASVHKGVNLAYSDALGYGTFFEGPVEAIVMSITQQIKESEDLIKIVSGDEITLGEFYRKFFCNFNWRTTTLLSKLRDFAFTAALVGDRDISLEALSKFLSTDNTVHLRLVAENLRDFLSQHDVSNSVANIIKNSHTLIKQ